LLRACPRSPRGHAAVQDFELAFLANNILAAGDANGVVAKSPLIRSLRIGRLKRGEQWLRHENDVFEKRLHAHPPRERDDDHSVRTRAHQYLFRI
jgi:hypothetical protein